MVPGVGMFILERKRQGGKQQTRQQELEAESSHLQTQAESRESKAKMLNLKSLRAYLQWHIFSNKIALKQLSQLGTKYSNTGAFGDIFILTAA